MYEVLSQQLSEKKKRRNMIKYTFRTSRLWMYVKYKFTFSFSSSRNWTRKASLARIPEIQENFLGLRSYFVLKVSISIDMQIAN